MEKATTPSDTDTTAPPSRKKRSGKWFLLALALAIVAGSGGAAWYLLKAGTAHETKPEVKAEPVKPTYAALETFTVNLLSDDGQSHHLQTNITLDINNPAVEEELKQHDPAVRNAILMLLSSKTNTELLTTEGKKKLADEVLATVNATLSPPVANPAAANQGAGAAKPGGANPPGPVRSVLFTAFIID